MGCCDCGSFERQFSDRMAKSNLSRYRRKGPDPSTRILIEVVRRSGPRGGTLLDIGAGIGVLHHELLGADFTQATHVEISRAYIEAARQETARRNHSEAVRFVHGDFVERAGELSAADAVTLDRVVCCYADYRSLLHAAAGKCSHFLALSYPRERWYVRLAFWLQNRVRALGHNPFRTFVHPERRWNAVLTAAGFEPCHQGGTFAWGVRAYRRRAPLSDAAIKRTRR